MSGKSLFSLVAVAGLLAASVPAWAHHSFSAEFDSERPVGFTGTVTGIDFINPHIQVYIDAKDENGQVIHWTIESAGTGRWHSAGLKKTMVTPGQQVAIRGFRAKDGTKNLAFMRDIKFIGGPNDGKAYEIYVGGLDQNGKPLQDTQ